MTRKKILYMFSIDATILGLFIRSWLNLLMWNLILRTNGMCF